MKPGRKVFKTNEEDPEVKHCTIVDSGRMGKDKLISKELATGSHWKFDHVQIGIWAAQIALGVLLGRGLLRVG